ncbi:hypothetical protein ACVIGB_007797 [Bradyrhizobium sp. USDA 4341]
MTSETAKAILMIFLFGSLSIAIQLSERSATKRLRALALQDYAARTLDSMIFHTNASNALLIPAAADHIGRRRNLALSKSPWRASGRCSGSVANAVVAG